MDRRSYFRKEVLRTFRLQGLQPKADAVRILVNAMEGSGEDYDQVLKDILYNVKTRIERRELKSVVIDGAAIEVSIAQITNGGDQLSSSAMALSDAFHCPRIYVDPLRKALRIESAAQRQSCLHALPAAKGQMMRDRFLLMQHRMQHHPAFRQATQISTSMDGAAKSERIELTPLSSLLGTSGPKYLLGVIVQPREGAYALEDLSTSVPLDLSQGANADAFVTENSIVVVEGYMEQGVLVASHIHQPPWEPRKITQENMGQADMFGSGLSLQHLQQLEELSQKEQDDMIVFVSDCHLDKPEVLAKLGMMLKGFESVPKIPIFVLMGNFSSVSLRHGAGNISRMQTNFESLGDLIQAVPRLAQNAQFVLVPGPSDPGAGSALPRPPIPNYFAEFLRQRVPGINLHLMTNPCRLRLYNQEVVIFREDILRKMQRHSLFPQDTGDGNQDVNEQIVKALLSQGHLCPLPLTARPINWQFDGALRLYPLPHLVILADQTEQYRWYLDSETTAVNPGSFPSESAFVVYHIGSMNPEFSRIPDVAT